MYHYQENIQDGNGTVLNGWSMGLYAVGGDPATAPAVTIYSDRAGTTPVPGGTVQSVSKGYVNFYVPSGRYSRRYYDASGALQWYYDDTDMASTSDLALATDLASTAMGKGAALVGYGPNGTVTNYLDNRVSVMSVIPSAQYAAIRDHTTTYDPTSAINTLIDSMFTAGGGVIEFPEGKFRSSGWIIKKGVRLVGVGAFGHGYLATGPTKLTVIEMIAGTTWAIDTPVGGASNAGVCGFDIKGLGAGSTNGGVRIRTGSYWSGVTYCHFSNFGEQAILNEGVVSRITNNLVINSVLNRTRTQLTGTIEDKGTDAYIFQNEAGPSLTSGEGENGIVNITDLATFTADISSASTTITNASSMTNVALGNVVNHASIPVGARVVRIISGNSFAIDVLPTATTAGVTITPRRPDLYICGILLGGANAFCSDSNGEFAERGIHSTNPTNTIVGCRGDRNAGHGCSGVAHWVGPKAGDNSYYATGLWDNFNFNGTQSGQLTGGRAYKVGAAAARYDLQCLGTFGPITSRWQVTGFRWSGGATIAAISNDASQPHDIRGGGFIGPTGTGATPDVANLEMYIPADAGSITITDFLNGRPGQDLYVRGNAFVTVQHNTAIILPGAVDMPMLANGLYHFKRDATAWRLVSRPFRSSAAITSPTGGATIDTQARTAIDSIRTALTASGITL